jgi:RNA polymerase sigma-70 factor (ECF subfamily)
LACRSLDRAAAEEIVQDTFLAVWRRAADFDPTRGSFRTWLVSISHHRMLDELRARSRRPQVAGDTLLDQTALSADEPLPDEALWLAYQRNAVSEALAALPEPQRAALRLAFFADLTHEEVAKALKVPLGTAKTRIRSGLRSLERHLGSLVALLTVTVIGGGSWLYHHHALEDAQTQRAVHLLSDSQTKALRLLPRDASDAPEMGMHATFRSALGANLSVLTLTHFPPPPEGAVLVFWIRTPQGWQHLNLKAPDRDGKSLQILETPWMTNWPMELRITTEAAPTGQPLGATVVQWMGPSSGDQPALP